jgi:SAM-dependent methyltransferase
VHAQRRGLLGASGLGVSLASMAAARPVAAAAASPTPADILKSPAWPPEFPFGPDELSRYDEAPDSAFYSAPRFVTHIDDAAIGALTKYYGTVFPPSGSKDAALLDICSSWISHYPPVRLRSHARAQAQAQIYCGRCVDAKRASCASQGYTAGRISGLGMNAAELGRNGVLSDFVVADLNAEPKLPYPDNTFDVVTNAVSVDYLTRPLEVMKEVQRVLKPVRMRDNSMHIVLYCVCRVVALD